MKIHPAMTSQPVRFGKNTWYERANGFLNIHDTLAQNIEDKFAGKKEGSFAKKFGSILKSAAETFFKHDYHDMSAIGPFGRIIVNNPKGAILTIVTAMIGGRLVHALERAPKLPDGTMDLRELRDIAIRDLTTCGLVFFALHPLTEKVGAWLQNHRKIELRHLEGKGYGSMKTYSELQDTFTVKTPTRLAQILGRPHNHTGLQQAIDQALKNEHLTAAGQEQLKALKQVITGLGQKPSHQAVQQAAEKGFKIIEALDADRLRVMNNETAKGVQTLLKPGTKNFAEKVPQYAQMFANYARNSRVGADAFSLALMVGILGWGIPYFNEWYTEREFRNRKAQLTPTPKALVKTPQSAMGYTPANSVFQTTTYSNGYPYSPWAAPSTPWQMPQPWGQSAF